jgi:hypothetical protein
MPLLWHEPVVVPLHHRPPRLRPLPITLLLITACGRLRSRTTTTSSKTQHCDRIRKSKEQQILTETDSRTKEENNDETKREEEESFVGKDMSYS